MGETSGLRTAGIIPLNGPSGRLIWKVSRFLRPYGSEGVRVVFLGMHSEGPRVRAPGAFLDSASACSPSPLCRSANPRPACVSRRGDPMPRRSNDNGPARCGLKARNAPGRPVRVDHGPRPCTCAALISIRRAPRQLESLANFGGRIRTAPTCCALTHRVRHRPQARIRDYRSQWERRLPWRGGRNRSPAGGVKRGQDRISRPVSARKRGPRSPGPGRCWWPTA